MKKITFVLLAVMACVFAVQAKNYTLVMGDQWGAEDCDLTEWTQEGFTFTPAMGENPKDKVPAYKSKNQEVRFYALNTLTITAPDGSDPIIGLVFTLSAQGVEEQAEVVASVGEVATQEVGGTEISWHGSAQSVTLTVGATNSLHTEDVVEGSGQLDFTTVEIITGAEDSETHIYMSNATLSDDGNLEDWTQANIHFVAQRGDDETVNFPTLKSEGSEARFYKGNTLTISTVDGRKLSSLEFVLSEQGFEQQAELTVSTGSVFQAEGQNVKWSGDANSITFSVGENIYGTNAKKGQFDFSEIYLSYANTASVLTEVACQRSGVEVEYYDMSGVRVYNPGSGLYICKKESEVYKVVRH